MFYLDVAMSIDSLLGAQESYVVSRQARRSLDATGHLIDVSPTQVTILANVQPAGREELRMPDGNYARDGIVVYTRSPLQVASLDGLQEADAITAFGRVYEVSQSDDWFGGSGYYRAVALLREGR